MGLSDVAAVAASARPDADRWVDVVDPDYRGSNPRHEVDADTVAFSATEAQAREYLATHPAPADGADWLDVSNYASALYTVRRTAEAYLWAKRALSLRRTTPTLLNLAVILETFGRFRDALSLEREANALDPSDPFAGSLLANALNRLGLWDEGWPVHTRYHANWEFLRPFIPQWDGGSLSGKRVLVLSGGGYGDNILFARWLPRLKGLGARSVTYLVHRAFAPVAATLAGVDEVLLTDDGYAGVLDDLRPADFDIFVSILSLPQHLGLRIDSPRAAFRAASYIHADTARVAIRRTVLVRGATPVIGFCWKAGELQMPRRHRSLSAADVSRVLSTQARGGADWVSLVTDELPPPPHRDNVLTPAIRNWADTAACIACCDLVVSVDTGVAHLAGAMGVPTWVILPGFSAWMYLLDRADCPFYPSMRLFRNRGEGIANAVDAVCAALSENVPRRRAA